MSHKNKFVNTYCGSIGYTGISPLERSASDSTESWELVKLHRENKRLAAFLTAYYKVETLCTILYKSKQGKQNGFSNGKRFNIYIYINIMI